jgi:hypothetical protein
MMRTNGTGFPTPGQRQGGGILANLLSAKFRAGFNGFSGNARYACWAQWAERKKQVMWWAASFDVA